MTPTLQQRFAGHYAILWPGLSRTANLLVVMNISLFFITGAVRCGGYYFPIVSLSILALAALVMLIPSGWHDRAGFYLAMLVLHVAAAGFLGASIRFWLMHGLNS